MTSVFQRLPFSPDACDHRHMLVRHSWRDVGMVESYGWAAPWGISNISDSSLESTRNTVEAHSDHRLSQQGSQLPYHFYASPVWSTVEVANPDDQRSCLARIWSDHRLNSMPMATLIRSMSLTLESESGSTARESKSRFESIGRDNWIHAYGNDFILNDRFRHAAQKIHQDIDLICLQFYREKRISSS